MTRTSPSHAELVGTADRLPALTAVLAGLALAVLLPSLATSIANVGLPAMAESFGASFRAVQWIVLAYLLAITTLIVGAGRLGDVLGRRRLLLAGIGTFTTASLMCALSPTLGWLIAARVLQGLGAAAMLALAMAFVAQAVPRARTGSAMGLLGTMSAVGTALGPSLGGGLIIGFGWRAVFAVNVPLGVLALVLAHRTLPADRPRANGARRRFDYPGTLLLAVTLGVYALAVTSVSGGIFGPLNLSLWLVAVAGLSSFVLVEARTADPLIRLAMFRDAGFGTGLITNLLVSTVMMTSLVVGPFHLSGALALGPGAVGLVMSAGPVVAALMSAVAGRAVDRLGAPRMVVAALIVVISGCAGLSAAPVRWGIPGYVVPLVVVTTGYAIFQAANNTAVMSEVRPDDRGLASGMLNLARNLGLITGASVMGAVFALASGPADVTAALPDDVARGTRWAFAVAALLVTAGLAVVVGRRAPAAGGSAATGHRGA